MPHSFREVAAIDRSSNATESAFFLKNPALSDWFGIKSKCTGDWAMQMAGWMFVVVRPLSDIRRLRELYLPHHPTAGRRSWGAAGTVIPAAR
jgi:hypothetical protein